jgi:multiple sugar transport system permease protein
MAGMQGIPRDLYESAAVDGASWWRRERSITLPLLRRPIALSLIISVTGSLLAFNQFFILTQGGPGTSTDTVVMWIYQTAFVRLHLGAATAMAIVLVVAVGLITAAQFFFLREETEK